MPTFSVISPVYNTSSYLKTFFDSVLNQTFTDFELILVDDGSTDNSLEICRDIASQDSRIKVLTQQNQGAGAARNKGLQNASGKYILFFDSDDWVNTNLLQVVHNEIENEPCDLLIYGSEEVLFDNREIETGRNKSLPEKYNLRSMQECRNYFCGLVFSSYINVPWNKVFLKSIIDEYNIVFPDTRRAQDAFFNMEYYKHISTLRTLDKVLYCYRTNTQDKIWKKFPKDLYKIDIKYDEYMVNIFKEFGIYSGKEREKIDTLFYNSLLRTVGFCRNPKWYMNYRQKIAYIKEIIDNSYNKQRAGNAITSTEKSRKIKKYILDGNAHGLLALFYTLQFREKLYEFYVDKIKR